MSETSEPTANQQALLTVGWREWLALPGLGIPAIKAKVDTGARSSSLHAANVETFAREGKRYVRFKVQPGADGADTEPADTEDSDTTFVTEAELLEFRRIRSSDGHQSLRPVVRTTVRLLGQEWEIELTLAARDSMGFPMLLGREALRGRFLVDSGSSYLGGRRQRKKTEDKRAKN